MRSDEASGLATMHGALDASTVATSIAEATARLGPGPLTEAGLVWHIHPLFARVLGRGEACAGWLGEIYLANHSLGRPLDRAALDVQEAMDHWYADMDGAWGAWTSVMHEFRAGIARLIGLSRADAIVPKTGAGQGLRAVLNAIPEPAGRRLRVLATRGEFDSIDFILKTYAQRGRIELSWAEPVEGDWRFEGQSIARQIEALGMTGERGGGLDLVVVSQVMFNTGQIVPDLDAVVWAAHRAGALVLIDTYHSAGVLPMSFDQLDADFAIGGSYKYTRGGPGACWLAIHPRHLEDDRGGRLVTLDTGWFAKREVFGYERLREGIEPRAAGGDAWLECTPAVLMAYQARAGLELTLALGVDRLREYSLQQQAELRRLLEARGLGANVLELADVERGAFLTIAHDKPKQAAQRLREKGVNVDARAYGVRLCPDILNTRAELEVASAKVAEVWAER
jgi:kynureninase